jgi:hypothetical protein
MCIMRDVDIWIGLVGHGVGVCVCIIALLCREGCIISTVEASSFESLVLLACSLDRSKSSVRSLYPSSLADGSCHTKSIVQVQSVCVPTTWGVAHCIQTSDVLLHSACLSSPSIYIFRLNLKKEEHHLPHQHVPPPPIFRSTNIFKKSLTHWH